MPSTNFLLQLAVLSCTVLMQNDASQSKVMRMEESRRISVSLPPDMLARLDAYAREHRWSRSTAAAVLIEEGLRDPVGNDVQEGGQ